MQQRQRLEFAVQSKDKVVQKVGRSSILQPKTNFKGSRDSIKWYPDRPKKKTN